MGVYEKHMTAIQSGKITKTNIIGLRKIFNAMAWRGYSSMTAPKITPEQAQALADAVTTCRPLIAGELHASGLKVLRNRRYAKRWTGRERAIIDAPDLRFQLVGWDNRERYHSPIYRAVSFKRGHFDFVNWPWQSGGNGPEKV